MHFVYAYEFVIPSMVVKRPLEICDKGKFFTLPKISGKNDKNISRKKMRMRPMDLSSERR